MRRVPGRREPRAGYGAATVPLAAGLCALRGRRTNSLPQSGQTPLSELAHVAQKVLS
jgi:hypothetical protein